MKIKTYYLILAIASGLFFSSSPGRAEQSPSGEKPLLINQPHPALAGIDKLHVAVLRYGTTPDKDVPVFKQLEVTVREKLQQAGIESDTTTADKILNIPELRIYVSTLRLEDSQRCVFSIRTALARGVCLKNERNPVFKADIWQTTPAMQAVTAEGMSAKVADIVLQQVEDFINIYKTTNPTGTKPSDAKTSEADSLNNQDKQIETDVNPAATGYLYVASKSRNVFHKPDCRWAKNISPENLVTYKSKDEAIKAGKRPCKTCNP